MERFDGCEVVKKLSTGPITDLYHVVQEPLGRPAFIKALGSSILPSSPFAASLEREARLLAELNHPNILKVYDFVRRGERMWLVLEYVDGVSLDEVMKRAKRLPEAFACAIALEVVPGAFTCARARRRAPRRAAEEHPDRQGRLAQAVELQRRVRRAHAHGARAARRWHGLRRSSVHVTRADLGRTRGRAQRSLFARRALVRDAER